MHEGLAMKLLTAVLIGAAALATMLCHVLLIRKRRTEVSWLAMPLPGLWPLTSWDLSRYLQEGYERPVKVLHVIFLLGFAGGVVASALHWILTPG
jgi:hypothetical protein